MLPSIWSIDRGQKCLVGMASPNDGNDRAVALPTHAPKTPPATIEQVIEQLIGFLLAEFGFRFTLQEFELLAFA